MRRHARPTWPVGSQTRSSPTHLGPCRRVWHSRGIEKASAASLHRLGTACGKAQPAARYRADGSTMEGTSGAAEHISLRGEVCEAALSSAVRGSAVRRASRRASGGLCGTLERGQTNHDPGRRRLLRATPVTSERHEVPESRLGWGKAFTASGRGGRSQDGSLALPARGPWPDNSRLADLRKQARPSAARRVTGR